MNLSSENTKTALVGAGAFLVGLIIGLPVLGWWLFPVEWEDASPAHLSDANKADYVQMVADSLAATNDLAKAQERMLKLGPDAGQNLQDTLAASAGPENMRLSILQAAVGANLPAPTGEEAQPASGPLAMVQGLLPICAAIVLLLAVVGGGIFVYRRLQTNSAGQAAKPRPEVTQGTVAERVETPADITAEAGAEPVTTFKTTYMLGNDLFDESFSIDDQQGDFLGECGVSIGETIGVGDPKRVTAFEVWLFDKNDIRTVTKVVMSEHAFNDEGLKSKLAAKGEPVQARSDGIIEMETATLKVQARIVDMQYGSGALPTNSFFQQLTLEISAWKKSDL
jgi:hypothetical protein